MTRHVRAHNTARDSENRIHDDVVAQGYGFRGGLVPGTTIYGYMAASFPPEWTAVRVRFHDPVCEGDELVITASEEDVTAVRQKGTLCAKATRIDGVPCGVYPEAPLPASRPVATRETLIPGAALGTLTESLESAEPRARLELCNRIFMRNYTLEPWLHAMSEIAYLGAVKAADIITVRGSIAECFERKGRAFVTLDLLLSVGERNVERVRHIAIYRPGFISPTR